MKKIIRFFNDIFISFILIIFYFFIIGLIAFFYKLFFHKKLNKETYWEDSKIKLTQSYFESPY